VDCDGSSACVTVKLTCLLSVASLGSKVWGQIFSVWGFEIRVQRLGFTIYGSRLRVKG
jgi:hypothetical protein